MLLPPFVAALSVTVRSCDGLREARRDGSPWATAWQAATVARRRGTMDDGRRRGRRPWSPEDEGRWTTGDGAVGGPGRRRKRDDGRQKRRRGRPRSAKDGQKHRVPKGVCDGRPPRLRCRNAKDGNKILRKETGSSCCVQDKRRETKQLYALAAVRAKCTQQSLRACPNDRAQT